MVCAVVVAGCSVGESTAPGCTLTTVEAQSVKLVKAERVVRFTALVTDESGRPVQGGEVQMALAYGTSSETAGGPTTARARTNAQGIAVADASVRNVKLLAVDEIFPTWVAHHLSGPDLKYCESRDRGAVPDEVRRLVPQR